MFDFLEPVEPVQLDGAPLVQVLAQVRFNAQSGLSSHAGANNFQERLLDRYPRLLTEAQATLTAVPGNVSTSAVTQWRLTDLAGMWACVLGPEHLTIETNAYTTWPSLRERIQEALKVLAAVATPRVRERIGLRYINRITAGVDGTYAGRLHPALLGLGETPAWRNHVAASLSQMMLTDGSTQLTVRYGRGPEAQGFPPDAFVLDIDCADETPKTFDPDDALIYFDTLNDGALRCFFACLDERYQAELQPKGDVS